MTTSDVRTRSARITRSKVKSRLLLGTAAAFACLELMGFASAQANTAPAAPSSPATPPAAAEPTVPTAPDAAARGTWDMRVCAAPENMPASSRTEQGFENKIAAILADQLGAKLSFVWTDRGDKMVRYHLRPGECDVVMEVGDGVAGVLSTIPYYQSPYVFLYRKDAPFTIESLNDPILKTLKIGTYPYGIPFVALFDLGLGDNIVQKHQIGGVAGPDFDTPLLGALTSGEADVAIIYGPVAAYFAEQHPGEWQITPVSPLILPPLVEMFRTWTIGVRPHDEALRDLLNVALAQRWDDIQAVLTEAGVPLVPLPKPVESTIEPTEKVRVGVVLPTPTGNPLPLDTLADAARLGATMAGGSLGGDGQTTGPQLKVMQASAPTAEAATRAAERLTSAGDVDVLVGGVGDDQAAALQEVAKDRHVPFLNIGSIATDLRAASCDAYTFDVAASASMYLDGLTQWYAEQDAAARWFIVAEDTPDGAALAAEAAAAVEASGGTVAGTAGIPVKGRVYAPVFAQVREAAPDVVLVLLPPDDQEFFLAQYDAAGITFEAAGLPYPVMQTREFYERLLQAAPTAGGTRLALWDTTLGTSPATALNQRFVGQSGKPMDPSAWAAYAAVAIAYRAVAATRVGSAVPDSAGAGADGAAEGDAGAAVVAYLERPDVTFDVGKGPGVSFRAWDHQLRQPLYVVQLDPEAPWGAAPSAQAALAQVVATLPTALADSTDPSATLDALGETAARSTCDLTGGR